MKKPLKLGSTMKVVQFNQAVKADIEAGEPPTIRRPMRVFYGAQATDDCYTSWNAIKVYADGNPIFLGGPFESEEAAEAYAAEQQLVDHFDRKKGPHND